MKKKPKKLPNSLPEAKMTVSEVAALLNITPQGVRNHIHTGNLIAHKEAAGPSGTESKVFVITGVSEKQKKVQTQSTISKKKDRPLPGYFAPGRWIGDPNCSSFN